MLLMFIPVALSAQNVTGTVTDAQNGEPLIGVTVKSLDGTGMAVTDFDGNYTVTAGSKERLLFSYVGYVDKVIPTGGKTRIDVQMESDVQTLEDVVTNVGGSTTNPEDEVGKILGRFEVRASLQGTSPVRHTWA